MNRTAIEFSFVLLVALLLGTAVATHWLAWTLGQQPALGEPVWSWHFLRKSVPFYEPWRGGWWWWQWGNDLYGLRAAAMAGGLTAAGAIALWLFGMLVRLGRRMDRVFGKKEWGTAADAARAGLLPRHLGGTVLGQIARRLICYEGDEHQLVAGAAGSGKTTGPVISTLLSWNSSALIYDPKRELYAQTARHRSQLGEVFYFDPTDAESACKNPLDEIRIGMPAETGDVQNLVSILIDPDGAKPSLEYWDTDAAMLLTGLVLHALHDLPAERRTLQALREMILAIDQTLARMQDSSYAKCRSIAEYISRLPDKQRAGVYGSAAAKLTLLDDPLVAEKTNRSDFRISDLVCSDRPVSCYLQVRPTDAVRMRPLTRLILTQVAQALMYDTDKATDGRPKKHRLLYLLEEFPSLGRLDFFSSQMRVMRGYGITALLIVQSFKDIINAYGHDQTIVDNCRIVVAFAASDPDTLRMISTMVGIGVETKENTTQPRSIWERWGYGWSKGSINISHSRRPLLDPGEVRQLGYDEQVVLVTGLKPLRAKKVKWFRHRALRKLGTNLRKDGVPPGQMMKAGAEEQPKMTSASPTAAPPLMLTWRKPPALHERLQELIKRLAWSNSKAAHELFPGIPFSTARFWISGARQFPDNEEAFVRRLVGGAEHIPDDELCIWLTPRKVEELRLP